MLKITPEDSSPPGAMMLAGKQVSRLCFGSLTMGPLQRGLPTEEGAALLLYAAERGVNFLDTADLYGTYPYIALALRRADYVVATKAYAYDEKTADEAFARAVKGIGREYIDVFLLHEQESEHTLRGHAEALEYLLRRKREGSIGAVGLSTHTVAAVHAAIQHGGLDVVHPLINKQGLGIQGLPSEDGSLPSPMEARAQMEQAIRLSAENGLFIYGMKALGGGHFIQQRRESFEYALSLPGIRSFAVGMQSFEEIDYNVDLFDGFSPDESLASRQPRQLLIQDWCEGCGNCQSRCKQGAISMEDGGLAQVDMEKCVLCGYCVAECPQFCIKVI